MPDKYDLLRCVAVLHNRHRKCDTASKAEAESFFISLTMGKARSRTQKQLAVSANTGRGQRLQARNGQLGEHDAWWRSPSIAVLIGGLLMGLTPAPFEAWPLAWVALVPLWRAVMTSSPASNWRLFWLGFLWSGTYHGIALSWITNLHPLTWMGVPWPASLAIALFAWAFITGLGSVTFGLWAVLLRQLSDRCYLNTAGRILAGTTLWIALETVLSWGPLYWPSLSYTQSPHNLWILHLGQIAGPMTVTAVIVVVNACWAEASLLWGRSPTPLKQSRPVLLAGLLLIAGLHGLGWTRYHQPSSTDSEAALRIGLIQGNIPTRIKLTPAGTRQAIQSYTDGYRQLAEQGADAVLTPEGSLPEVWTRAYQSRSTLHKAVLEKGVVLWLGTFRPKIDSRGVRHLTQSLININAQGQVTSQYNKVKLVPLGEYIPFQAVLGRLISRLSPVDASLLPGQSNQVFETPFGQAIIGICYESAYSHLFRQQAVQGGEWIMTASNNDPYPPRMMMQHHAQDVMRAIESDRWSVRVTNTGISGVVSPHGHTLWLSQPNQPVTHLATIYKQQTQTRYSLWGNWLVLVLFLLTSVVSALSFTCLTPKSH